MNPINENNLTEQSLIDWLKGEGYEHVYGPDINHGQARAEREDFRGVILKDRLLGAVRRINPSLPTEQAEMIVKEIADYSHNDLVLGNKEVYSWITNGKKISWRENGEEKTELVKLIDFSESTANEFLVVNQFTVQGIDNVCRLDAVIFVNGLPLGVFELKSGVRTEATIGEAYRDIEYYKKEIPKLFLFNQIVGLSDLFNARHGTISSSWERYGTWKGINTENDFSKEAEELEVLAKGLFNKERFLDVLQHFTIFEADSDGDAVTYTKKMCMYHQYYGVNKTITSTIRAILGEQDRKIGVFWHTQGSGKSLSMVFYVNKTKSIPELKGPAYVFLTDREDLDDQLFKTFSRTGYSVLAHRATSIRDLRNRLSHTGRELIFTTIQKFQEDPNAQNALTQRDNIIVLADEAHRTQYSNLAGNVRLALPNASFLGVTGTPISKNDKDTVRVFGNVVSSYKISQSVKDKSTVPIYYEGRLVPLHLADKFIDSKFDAVLGEVISDDNARMRKEWAVLEEVVGAPSRIEKIAEDIVNHFNNRPIEGKAMIVTMSRRIAVLVYEAIQKISGAPECAVVISNSDEYASVIQPEKDIKKLEKKFKKVNDSLKIAIVCDMWLTGFDVPCLHTMYLDKPLKNHGLMQAIARVNRVYKDKPGGLIVDYIGIAENLKKALAWYDSDIQNDALIPIDEVIGQMHTIHAQVAEFFGELPYKTWKEIRGVELVRLIQAGINEVITDNGFLSDERKMKYIGMVSKLSKLHALVMPGIEAMKIVSDLQFFQSVREAIRKQTVIPHAIFPEETETAIRSLMHDSIQAEGIVDLFNAPGEEKKTISIFDEKFVAEVKKSQYKNFAVDSVRKLLDQEIRARMRLNTARYETMLTLLEELIEKYENNVISSAEIIKQLLEIADGIKKLDQDSRDTGLSSEEIVFYDTLEKNPDLKNAGIDIKEFVKGLTKRIRRDLAIDWTNNETIKARIRQNVRILLLQKGIVEEMQTKRLIESIYLETVRVYREYLPV
ncbi:MAG: Type I site-specific deoxyribonuclease, HsdR family [Candidatus Nomurabacteria bacterium GW2011_GWA2_40_9]|uniref:Type I restriction enzyme endonuclease subunit n=1 Tax=Candidatus Nomurabacteria bacterium GW2011_GWA2_40_9 TaxID=1618734 RepID=A0A0G0TW01_9BACT|nr:MAG: Type I site-specific deoxyribonuclease, HsdR family [Candidatus Nomurabacteria bacterium GW2011_GWA2_40_9]